MKYLYQQMLAFFVVIMTVLVFVMLSFYNTSKYTVFQNTEKQLYGYANALLTETDKNAGLSVDVINNAEHLLVNQEVKFFVFDANATMLYSTNQLNLPLGQDEWDTLESGESVAIRLDDKNKLALVIVPYFVQGVFSGGVAVAAPISGIEENVATMQKNFFLALLLSSIAAVGLSFIFAKYQTDRMKRMRNATHQIAEGDFDVHLNSKGKDEFDDLADDFNLMVESLKASHEEIERQENRRRQFMADAAHEMKTPLTTINGLLEGLAYDAIPEEQKAKSIELMQNETKRLIRLVVENLDYEKIRSNQIMLSPQNFNVKDTLDIIAEQLSGKAAEQGDQISVHGGEDILVYVDYDRFIQIVVNIVQNAIQFTQNGEISLEAEKSFAETIVKITDTGIGMSSEEIKNIWERYYKADMSRTNTKYGESGLGLAIVQQLMNLHNGTIEVTSEPGVGTTFTLIFPDDVEDEEKNGKG